eukprot:8800832-Pyramimonas_sp.AAC.1
MRLAGFCFTWSSFRGATPSLGHVALALSVRAGREASAGVQTRRLLRRMRTMSNWQPARLAARLAAAVA